MPAFAHQVDNCPVFLSLLQYPACLVLMLIWSPEAALLTILCETLLSMTVVSVVADRGSRMRSAAMMAAAMPVRLLSLAVDVWSLLSFISDLATGNRDWRK